MFSWLQSPSAVILKPPQNKVFHCFHFFPIYLPWSDGTGCHQNKNQFLLQSVSPIRKLPKASYPYPLEGIQNENNNHRKLIKLITWTTALSNSMKLWATLSRSTQEGRVMVESSDKTWPTGEGNGKPLQYSCLENSKNNSVKKRKHMTLKKNSPGR